MPKRITKTSKNTNCLEGVECPKCGHEDKFFVYAKILVEVTDDGTEDAQGDYEWDSGTYCECGECKHSGTLSDFTIEEWGREQETAAPDLLAAAQALLDRWDKGNLSQAIQALQKAVTMELEP